MPADTPHVPIGSVPIDTLVVSADGSELADLAVPHSGRRQLVGIVGAPGAGKSLLAASRVRQLGARAAHLPMDGFHLADAELARQGTLDRKGSPETFDAWGYAALLARLRSRPSYPVYAPGFERDLEQPIAGAIAIGPEADVVMTEGNYLLLDEPGWREVSRQLDEVWYVYTDDALRLQRLLDRHVAFGKSAREAAAWVARVDEQNARLVEATQSRADLLIDLTSWSSARAD